MSCRRCLLLLCLAVLASCGASVAPPVCVAWDDLRNWLIEGSPVSLHPDACGRLTTLKMRGPGRVVLTRETGGTVGVSAESDCSSSLFRLGAVPIHSQNGVWYMSAVLPPPSVVSAQLEEGCATTMHLEYRP